MVLDGWVGGWVDGGMDVKAVLRIAYSNQKTAKKGKMDISTSVWGAQHPNAGRNIQQSSI